jgi:cell division protein FtsL
MILLTLLATSLGVTLFIVKYQVQDLENVLVDYNRKITENREAVHVLKAEWSHLNQPARLRKLAERYLGMVSVQPAQVGIAKDFFSEQVPSNLLSVSKLRQRDLKLVLPLTTQKYIVESN